MDPYATTDLVIHMDAQRYQLEVDRFHSHKHKQMKSINTKVAGLKFEHAAASRKKEENMLQLRRLGLGQCLVARTATSSWMPGPAWEPRRPPHGRPAWMPAAWRGGQGTELASAGLCRLLVWILTCGADCRERLSAGPTALGLWRLNGRIIHQDVRMT